MPALQYSPPSPPIYDSRGSFLPPIASGYDNDMPQALPPQRSSQPAINIMWSDHQPHFMTEPRGTQLPGLSLNKNSGTAGDSDASAFFSAFGGRTEPFVGTDQPLINKDTFLFDSPCSTPPLSGSEQPTIGADFTLHHNWSSDSLSPDENATRNSRRNGSRMREMRHYQISSAAHTAASAPMGPRKITGACSRCRRLKMRCEFKEGAHSCSRCTTGRHECILEERKPKRPGEKETLQQKLKQREQEIEDLVTNVRKEAPAFTPLTFVPPRLQLSADQRERFKNVLANASTTRRPGPAQLEDIRSLLENEDWSSSGDSASDSSDDAASRNSPLGDSHDVSNRNRAPIAVMAEFSMNHEGGPTYFQPGPFSSRALQQILIERGEDAPPILVHGLITIDEVELLFDIFFKRIQPIVAVLDENIHTPSAVLLRSPFLFTVICAIASRFLRLEPGRRNQEDIYPLAIHYAKTASASALIDGRKTVETCQAYLLMCLYAPGGKHFEDSRTWAYSGLAIRLATELNLHAIPLKPASEDERTVREWNNKVRTWMVCFNLDRTLSSQYGKDPVLREDAHIRNLFWYKSPFTSPYDIHLQAHTALLKIMSRFHEKIAVIPETESAENLNRLIEAFEDELSAFEIDLNEKYNKESDKSDEGCIFRASLNPFTINYSRLVILYQSLQRTFDNGAPPNKLLLLKATSAATTLLRVFMTHLVKTKQLPYAPDCYFVYSGFAATFLLKLIDPKSPSVVDKDQKDRMIELTKELVEVLKRLSLDETHTAGLYAQFISGMLKKVCKEKPLPTPSTTTFSEGMSSIHGSPALSSVSMSTCESASTSNISTSTPYDLSSVHFDFPCGQSFKLEQTTPESLAVPLALPLSNEFTDPTNTVMWDDVDFFNNSSQQNNVSSWAYAPDGTWVHQDFNPGQNHIQPTPQFEFYPSYDAQGHYSL